MEMERDGNSLYLLCIECDVNENPQASKHIQNILWTFFLMSRKEIGKLVSGMKLDYIY